MIGNKMGGGIHANEEIIVSPDKPKQFRQLNGRTSHIDQDPRLHRPEKQDTPFPNHEYMQTPRSSNESKRERSRPGSVQSKSPLLQLPNDRSLQNYSGQRPSEYNSNKHSAVSLHRSKVPESIIEEEKHDNNEVEDHLENEKLNVPVSNFDNKMSSNQLPPPNQNDTSAIGMNKSTAISANVSQPQKINSSAYS